MKRYLCLLLVSILFSFPISASANGPGPVVDYHIYLSGLPEGTVYVDLLIPMEKDDPHYTDLVSENLPEGFMPDSQIVTYHHEGFCSYTFHYKDAHGDIAVGSDKKVSFFTEYDWVPEVAVSHVKDIQDRGQIRLAMLDRHGNILQVSSSFSVILRNPFAQDIGGFYYDAAADQWKQNVYVSAFAVILYFFISLIGLLATCLVERLVAWPFGLGKSYGPMIRWTNVVSQIVMRVAHILLYMLFLRSYIWTVFLLEVLVYTGEYLFYRKRMVDISRKRVMAYTAAANTASLVIGHLLNLWLVF